ncbi:MAG TPA: polysaccharide deacetylase family protein [Polyangiaceae bacterium]|nr:polysaccharide deacetylase family protein [Polyangiaceae bacterium]
MKHLISVSVLVLSAAACSSDPSTNGGGSAGSSSTHVGGGPSAGGQSPSTGGSGVGVGGSGPSTGGSGPVATGGSGSTTGGSGPSGGSSSVGTGGTGPIGTAGSGNSAGGPTTGTGGSGPTSAVKCDNLSLAPKMTGVAKPSGAAGGLKVLDWAGFTGAASFTFDDNTPSQLANYTALKGTGGHFTWFLIASSAGTGYKATIADGQEIANHTQTHPMSPATNEVDKAQTTLKTNYGVDVHSMAAPNCLDGWKQYAAPAKLFQDRGPCGGSVAAVSPRDSTDPFGLPAYLPAEGAAASALSGQISAGKWRIYVIHGFDSQNGTYQPVPIASVTGAMSKAVSDGYWVEGMTNIGAYWQGQKLIPASATTTAMWTLPANFPPNMCVRITTTGGTVTQKGNTIAWDDHGYYQISLDAGEVTIK